MNSGKYLYSSTSKKSPSLKKINVSQCIIIYIFILQKPQFKYITNETINHFKKFLNRLYKNDEENVLNKKKKREQKNKLEKNKLNNINNYNYYQGIYMPQMPMNNPNPGYYNENPNLYYFNVPPYQIGQQMMGQTFYPQFVIPQNTLEDHLNIMYNRGIVNNIIGAFFIKECQERLKQKQIEKRQVPISTVELNNEHENENLENNNDNNNTNEIGDESNNKLSYMVKDFKLNCENVENQNEKKEEKEEQNLKNKEPEEIKEEKNEEEEKNISNSDELKKPNIL